MIGRLTGTLTDKQLQRLIVDVGGVGYDVTVPLSTMYALGDLGSRVELRIYTHVREDALHLFGFATALEQTLFERLISVSGIGPKVALAVVSGSAASELRRAIALGDAARFQAIPGIGKKTAERIVLELKGSLPETLDPRGDAPSPAELTARDALVELGYSVVEAERVLAGVDPGLSAEERVREALKRAA